MPRRALRCVVDISIHALDFQDPYFSSVTHAMSVLCITNPEFNEIVTCPGVWLPRRDDVYLSVCLFGEVRRTQLTSPVFPLYFSEKFYFDKVFYSAYEPSHVALALNDEPVVIELIQLSDIYEGGRLLASYECSANNFLYPYPTYSPSYGTLERDIIMTRSLDFPGIAPRLEFSSSTTIKETSAPYVPGYDDDVLRASRSRGVSPTRKSRSRSRSRKSVGASSLSYARPTVSTIGRSRSLSPNRRLRMDGLNLESSVRPPFIVAKVKKDLIGRNPGTPSPRMNVECKHGTYNYRSRSCSADKGRIYAHTDDYLDLYRGNYRPEYSIKTGRRLLDSEESSELSDVDLDSLSISRRYRSPSPILTRPTLAERHLERAETELIKARVDAAIERNRTRDALAKMERERQERLDYLARIERMERLTDYRYRYPYGSLAYSPYRYDYLYTPYTSTGDLDLDLELASWDDEDGDPVMVVRHGAARYSEAPADEGVTEASSVVATTRVEARCGLDGYDEGEGTTVKARIGSSLGVNADASSGSMVGASVKANAETSGRAEVETRLEATGEASEQASMRVWAATNATANFTDDGTKDGAAESQCENRGEHAFRECIEGSDFAGRNGSVTGESDEDEERRRWRQWARDQLHSQKTQEGGKHRQAVLASLQCGFAQISAAYQTTPVSPKPHSRGDEHGKVAPLASYYRPDVVTRKNTENGEKHSGGGVTIRVSNTKHRGAKIRITNSSTPPESPIIHVGNTSTPPRASHIRVTNTATPTRGSTVRVTNTSTPPRGTTVRVTSTATRTRASPIRVTNTSTPPRGTTVLVTNTATPPRVSPIRVTNTATTPRGTTVRVTNTATPPRHIAPFLPP